MSEIPSDLRFAMSHEWARLEGDVATIGVSDYAQKELADVVFVELPEKGRRLAAGEATAVVESVKTASDIYSPLSGEVIDVNQAIADDPSLVNSEPYQAGWFFKLKVSRPEEFDSLSSSEDYAKSTE